MLQRREASKGPPSADILVCFPSRGHHLTLKPKPICSPARSSEYTAHHHHRRKSCSRGSHASPVLWAKTNPAAGNSDISEPTSPKVNCAGQIIVRPKPRSSCKNWQSVMEEIERLHKKSKQKKGPGAWISEALRLKKDVMQFLTTLRNIRFDLRCFGSFPMSSDDDEDDEDMDGDDEHLQSDEYRQRRDSGDNKNSRALFSKWFMILQENDHQSKEFNEDGSSSCCRRQVDGDDDDYVPCAPPPPPPNALLLMRCRSAPAKRWLEEKEDDGKEEKNEIDDSVGKGKEKEEERLVVMRCGTDFSKFSSDIAKETWLVGGFKDVIPRNQSWKI